MTEGIGGFRAFVRRTWGTLYAASCSVTGDIQTDRQAVLGTVGIRLVLLCASPIGTLYAG